MNKSNPHITPKINRGEHVDETLARIGKRVEDRTTYSSNQATEPHCGQKRISPTWIDTIDGIVQGVGIGVKRRWQRKESGERVFADKSSDAWMVEASAQQDQAGSILFAGEAKTIEGLPKLP